jgi:hypothetical protein
MWNDIHKPMRDPGLEGARRYLVAKTQVQNNHSIFHNGKFHAIALAGQPFKLYVLAHGCTDGALMASGEFYERQQPVQKFWAASKLARELVLRGLPGNLVAHIKL